MGWFLGFRIYIFFVFCCLECWVDHQITITSPFTQASTGPPRRHRHAHPPHRHHGPVICPRPLTKLKTQGWLFWKPIMSHVLDIPNLNFWVILRSFWKDLPTETPLLLHFFCCWWRFPRKNWFPMSYELTKPSRARLIFCLPLTTGCSHKRKPPNWVSPILSWAKSCPGATA